MWAVTLLTARGIHGQTIVQDERAGDAASVFALAPLADAAAITASGLAVALPYLFASSLITPHCPCRPESVNAFDRHAIGHASDAADWVSTATVGLSLVLPPVADLLLLSSRRTLLEDVTVFVEAVSVNSAVVTFFKYSVQRPIPRVYADPAVASSPANYRAFYSGHTSVAFAALSAASITVNRRYHLTWQPWVVTALVGGSVGYERILAGRHFYTDVLVGAMAGLAIGGGVALVHLRGRPLHLTASRSGQGGAVASIQGRF